MRSSLVLILLGIAAILWQPFPAQAGGSARAEVKTIELRRNLDSQMERLKAARERAEARLELSRIKSSQNLSVSEEDLLRQLESLERIGEQLRDQMEDSKELVTQLQRDVYMQLAEASAEIDAQMRQTRELIRRIQSAREHVESGRGQGTGSDCQTCPYTGQPPTMPTDPMSMFNVPPAPLMVEPEIAESTTIPSPGG